MADDPAPFDPQRIFDALAEHRVDYVLIGGLAVQTHGHTRMTNDVDVMADPAPANLERLADALRALEARVLNPGSEGLAITAQMLPRAALWQFATPHGDIDVLHEAPGAAPYDQLSGRAMTVELGPTHVQVVSLDDLVRMKLARGREIDRKDVQALSDVLE
jgi:hypothetical protein